MQFLNSIISHSFQFFSRKTHFVSKKRGICFLKPLSRVYVRAIYSSKTRKHPAYPAYLAIIPHLRPFIPHPNLHLTPPSHNYPAYPTTVLLRDKRDKRLLFPLHYYIRARPPNRFFPQTDWLTANKKPQSSCPAVLLFNI